MAAERTTIYWTLPQHPLHFTEEAPPQRISQSPRPATQHHHLQLTYTTDPPHLLCPTNPHQHHLHPIQILLQILNCTATKNAQRQVPRTRPERLLLAPREVGFITQHRHYLLLSGRRTRLPQLPQKLVLRLLRPLLFVVLHYGASQRCRGHRNRLLRTAARSRPTTTISIPRVDSRRARDVNKPVAVYPPGYSPRSSPVANITNSPRAGVPGPLNHPQNIELSSLLTLLDSSTATSSDASILHASLLHRLKMDHQIETLAREIGLYFHPTPLHASPEHAPPSDAIPGIEDFPPPPMAPLTVEARRLLLGCRGEWKEAVMPLPKTGVRCRYRKPKYWIVSVAAANGWTSDMLDARIGEWFMGWEGEEGGFDRISGPPGSPLAVGV
ncbi:hypothetical protein FN846DRAFT_586408 [Sphaerosporella brunnea]|uniref:Uncharacterized protein n=1 Tax=Sphaerosporella brunnea TaxID=1250544 RepID=A0A5J5F159_9PEZI|nr:hypothetical protein FN846DRAFT_586408 [Sphaerosporella brunnea]